MQYITSPPNREYLREDVFEIWRNRAVNLHIQLMDDIILSLNKLKSAIVKEHLENINSLVLQLENYKSESLNIILEHDRKQIEEKISIITQIIVNLMDYCRL
jgi:hypothetical protein